jgi:hypothetical protein
MKHATWMRCGKAIVLVNAGIAGWNLTLFVMHLRDGSSSLQLVGDAGVAVMCLFASGSTLNALLRQARKAP